MTSHGIDLVFASAEEIKINKNDAFRYMGSSANNINEEMEELYSLCLCDFLKSVKYKACVTKTQVILKDQGIIDLGFGEFQSFNLEKNLEGCKEAYVFAATCGAETDRLILRLSKSQPSKSVTVDAIASSAVEGFCDFINNKLKENSELRPRFSCGYGDFDLENQKSILDFLDAYRKTGITLSDGFLMTPKKTVTAIVGIKRTV